MGFISIFLFIIPILFVIGIIICIIVLVKKNQINSNFKITSHTLLQFYLYLISFITLGVLVIGAGLTAKALLSYKVSIPFSYTLYKSNSEEDAIKLEDVKEEEFKECYEGEPIDVYGSKFCFNKSLRKTELITGITLFISMSILFSIHQFALSKIKKENRILWLKKTYTFLSLILYSIVGLITIPTSIYLITNFLLFEPTKDIYSTPTSPAMTCSIMIISIPLWIYFLNRTIQLKEK